MSNSFWRGRRVFVTGHTGFMGGWLCERLIGLGAEVTGYALPPPTEPNLFQATGLAGRMVSIPGDVRDADGLTHALTGARAEVVFHLAAQPLVRRAHREPVPTFSTNVMGVVNILEAMRVLDTVASAIVVTTDKVYENREWTWGYRENDMIGGFEPYGVSKACAEMAVEAYRSSYFHAGGPAVATVRAGNIIGGGDWAEDRLVPDAARAFAAGKTLSIRNPGAIRPWQHVLDPVTGMMELARNLAEPSRAADADWAGSWNLGPAEEDSRPVAWMADRLAAAWGPGARWTAMEDAGPHEARLLTLSSAKARSLLGWECRWRAEQAVMRAAAWYRAFYDGADMAAMTRDQINAYVQGDDCAEFQRQVPQKSHRAVA